jgi:hypothetical protein
MISDEAVIALRLLTGYWPTPEMSDSEMAVWMKELLACDFDESCHVMEILVGHGAHYRPSTAEFIAEYRRQRLRPKPYVPVLGAGSVVTMDDAKSGFAAARVALSEAKERGTRETSERREQSRRGQVSA